MYVCIQGNYCDKISVSFWYTFKDRLLFYDLHFLPQLWQGFFQFDNPFVLSFHKYMNTFSFQFNFCWSGNVCRRICLKRAWMKSHLYIHERRKPAHYQITNNWNNTCHKKCKSSGELKRYIKIYWNQVTVVFY